MFIVVPSGRTKPAVLGLSFSRSVALRSAAGKAAALELVEKAVTTTSLIAAKYSRGRQFVHTRSQIDMVPNRCRAITATQQITKTPSAITMSTPTRTTTL